MHAGKEGKCPQCQNMVIVPNREEIPTESAGPSEPIPPSADESLSSEQADEYKSGDFRLILLVSGAAVAIVSLIILAVVIRPSGSSPVEEAYIQPRESTMQESLEGDTSLEEPASLEDKLYKQTKIAFQSHKHGNRDIYVMNTNGSEQRRLTDNDLLAQSYY